MSSQEAEIDKVLAREPRSIEALVRKGELRSDAGDDRAATAFYRAALQAAAAGQPLSLGLKAAVQRAQEGLLRTSRLFEDYLEKSLCDAGLSPQQRPERFQASLDILTGRRHVELQLQRPGAYYFPGLPQRCFYDRSEFDWAPEVERAAGAMRDELINLLNSSDDDFTPYLVSDATRPRLDFHGLVDNPDWSTLYLWEKGGPVRQHIDRFPKTYAAVKDLDLPYITARAPAILFSRLRPGARIPAHHGMLNTRLICHLPLVLPPGCGFRVGGQTRKWHEGEVMIFDDTIEHEAWNGGSSDRIILIFDIWRPELSNAERRAIVALFEAIDSYGS